MRMSRRRDAPGSQRIPSVGTEKSADPEISDAARLHHDDPGSFVGMSKYDGLQELYVDRLLVAVDNADAVTAQSPSLQDLGVFGGC